LTTAIELTGEQSRNTASGGERLACRVVSVATASKMKCAVLARIANEQDSWVIMIGRLANATHSATSFDKLPIDDGMLPVNLQERSNRKLGQQRAVLGQTFAYTCTHRQTYEREREGERETERQKERETER
jgi:hypothetical protein